MLFINSSRYSVCDEFQKNCICTIRSDLPMTAIGVVCVASATLCSTIKNIYSSQSKRMRWKLPKLAAERSVKSRITIELQKLHFSRNCRAAFGNVGRPSYSLSALSTTIRSHDAHCSSEFCCCNAALNSFSNRCTVDASHSHTQAACS